MFSWALKNCEESVFKHIWLKVGEPLLINELDY